MSNPQISPDGMWRWEGSRWVPNGDQQLPPPPPPGGAYPYPTVYQTVVNPGTNGLAIASMVLGILWLYWIGSVLALIFGYVALNQIRSSHQGGKGMAIAGVVLGWIGVAVLVGFFVLVVAVGSSSSDYSTP